MSSKGKILLVEDNEALNESNSRALVALGYEVDKALTLGEARACLETSQPDIILLDVMLPDGDGIAFCEEIRGGTEAHILFLTGKTDQSDAIRGLAAGGDDYIRKPFHPLELIARIESATRRRGMAAPQTPQVFTKGSLKLDIVSSIAYLNGEDIGLAQKEFALLLLFAQNENRTMTELYEKVWGQPMVSDKQALRKAISRLRSKLQNSEFVISPERGEGYRFGEKNIP